MHTYIHIHMHTYVHIHTCVQIYTHIHINSTSQLDTPSNFLLKECLLRTLKGSSREFLIRNLSELRADCNLK